MLWLDIFPYVHMHLFRNYRFLFYFFIGVSFTLEVSFILTRPTGLSQNLNLFSLFFSCFIFNFHFFFILEYIFVCCSRKEGKNAQCQLPEIMLPALWCFWKVCLFTIYWLDLWNHVQLFPALISVTRQRGACGEVNCTTEAYVTTCGISERFLGGEAATPGGVVFHWVSLSTREHDTQSWHTVTWQLLFLFNTPCACQASSLRMKIPNAGGWPACILMVP